MWDRAIASRFLGIEAARGYRKGHNPSPESAMSTTAQEGETSSRDRAWIGSLVCRPDWSSGGPSDLRF